jgi:hypothetical protein
MPSPWSGGAQARIIGRIHGQETVNVLHFATNSVINDQGSLDTLLLQLAEALRDCVVEFLLPAVTQDWTFVQTDAKRIAPSTSDPILATGVPGNVGQLGVASFSFASTLVNVRTGQGGKSGRGRMFLPPAGEAQTQNSLVDGPTLVLIAAFTACVATKFMGANPETDWHLGVLSRKKLTAVGGSFDTAFQIATSLNPVAEAAIMSSRKVGRGS